MTVKQENTLFETYWLTKKLACNVRKNESI